MMPKMMTRFWAHIRTRLAGLEAKHIATDVPPTPDFISITLAITSPQNALNLN
jgi:hypothetical protein